METNTLEQLTERLNQLQETLDQVFNLFYSQRQRMINPIGVYKYKTFLTEQEFKTGPFLKNTLKVHKLSEDVGDLHYAKINIPPKHCLEQSKYKMKEFFEESKKIDQVYYELLDENRKVVGEVLTQKEAEEWQELGPSKLCEYDPDPYFKIYLRWYCKRVRRVYPTMQETLEECEASS